MNRYTDLHHTAIYREDGAWTICAAATRPPLAVMAARFWRDSGCRQHA